NRLHPPAPVNPLLICHIPLKSAQSIAQTDSLAAADFHALPSRSILFLPAKTTSLAQEKHLERSVLHHHGTWSSVTESAIGQTVSQDSAKTLGISGLLALPFLFLILYTIFGSLAAMALPLIIALVGSELALSIVAMISTHLKLSVFLTDIVSFLALGVGIDYALFISKRFRQHLDDGMAIFPAVIRSMQHAGRSVLYSGLAVSLAVATLLLGKNPYWQGLALGGAVAILSVLIAAMTLLPAIMGILGRKLSWGHWRLFPRSHYFWSDFSRFVVNNAAGSVGVGIALLLAFGWAGPRMQMQTPANLALMLPAHSNMREAVKAEQTLQGPGSIAPLAVVLHVSTTLIQTQTWQTVTRVDHHLS
ncbi:MAG: MMPL family transporter, partial [Firmicutes bacterium]|nr:MMPL family transporter [Bacillota bacterium]